MTDPGDRAVDFINALTHTKGYFARQKFGLRPWQERIVRDLFGTVGADGRRQYRTALLMLPRKNGKSELAAAIALYGLLGDREIGAEVYSAAADREQASLVFNVAAQMVRNDKKLNARCEIVDSQKRIVHRQSGSVYRAISAEAYSKHGFNASMVIYDELHAAPNRQLWDVLATSQGARSQPLMLAISTAGYDRQSILYELYDYACRIRDDGLDDKSFYQCIYEISKDADWADESVWHAANPALGDFRSLEEMRIAAVRAKQIPAQENAFRRLYLNQWTEQAERWIPMYLWDLCRGEIDREALKGRRCYIGMDLSSTSDLTALAAVFPREGGFDLLTKFFVPEETMHRRTERDRVQYREWARQGQLIITPGERVDYDVVRKHVQEWAAEFWVREVGCDPYNATDIMRRLEEDDGLTVTAINQNGYGKMSAPSKAFEKAIVARELRHDGHPVLSWNVGNVALEIDASGNNIKPSKKMSGEKIDGVIAAIMALDCLHRDPDPTSVYESQGVMVM